MHKGNRIYQSSNNDDNDRTGNYLHNINFTTTSPFLYLLGRPYINKDDKDTTIQRPPAQQQCITEMMICYVLLKEIMLELQIIGAIVTYVLENKSS
jgi:hypothetical protein